MSASIIDLLDLTPCKFVAIVDYELASREVSKANTFLFEFWTNSVGGGTFYQALTYYWDVV